MYHHFPRSGIHLACPLNHLSFHDNWEVKTWALRTVRLWGFKHCKDGQPPETPAGESKSEIKFALIPVVAYPNSTCPTAPPIKQLLPFFTHLKFVPV